MLNMTVVESLPARPLRFTEIEHMDEEDIEIAPFSGIPELDLVFAILFVTDDWLYGLGFDENRSEWLVVERAENPEMREQESEALDRVDTAINEWVEEKYDEQYGNEVFEV